MQMLHTTLTYVRSSVATSTFGYARVDISTSWRIYFNVVHDNNYGTRVSSHDQRR